MKVIVNWGQRNKNAKYVLKAKDVAGVAAELKARTEWGLFEGFITNQSDRIDEENGVAVKVVLSPWYKITMPKWPAYRSQSSSVQAK